MIYEWRGRNARGELVNGQIEATHENHAVDQLRTIGVAPVHLAPRPVAEEKSENEWWNRVNRKPITDEDLIIFSRQMYTLNRAGVPILRALAGLQASATKPAMVELLVDIRASLDQGRDLSTALARHQRIFGNFYVAMVRVGEMAGRLTEVFLRLSEHLEFERDA